jgi:hypothetical protein
MEPRLRTRHLRRVVLAVAFGALVVPATADAAKKKLPVITKVTPKTVSVGESLTITGKNFRVGKAKNTVLFKRDGGKAVFVKTGIATSKSIKITIPKSLEKYMAAEDGKPTASRFRLRVLTTRLGRSFTSASASPVIGPERVKPAVDAGSSAGAGAGGGGGGGVGDSTPVAPVLDPNADCDGDGVTNGFETVDLKTLPCVADTDGDGVTDGYEYASAVDLNNDDYRNPTQSLPYPGTRPYPNPLSNEDLNLDHDGDSLTLGQEFELWRYAVQNGADPSLLKLSYSAGLKYSVYSGGNGLPRVPALAVAGYDKATAFTTYLVQSGYATIDLPGAPGTSFLDINQDTFIDQGPGQLRDESLYLDAHGWSGVLMPDGWLSDDERDEDADGLSNLDEYNMSMTPAFWKARYSDETAYVVPYTGTSAIEPDSDGDKLRDGVDDQDHDDIPNFHEISRNMSSGRSLDAKTDALLSRPTTPGMGRVNPYNPCLPWIDSRTCPVTVPFESAWAPFHRPELNYFVFN